LLKGKTIAVTGSSGFVGHHLVEKIRKAKANVLGLDIKNGVDIADWEQVKCIDKIDILFHLAAKTFVPDSFKQPREFYQTNINSTLNALELCRKHKAKMIFASSYVYGTPKYLPIDEKHPLSAINPYAQSKIIGENLCRAYHRDFDMKIIIIRPFNIYGSGQNENFLIPSIIQQARKGVIELKDPVPKRDFVYISDVIEGYIMSSKYEKKSYDVFNLGSGKSYSAQEIVGKVTALFNHPIKVNFTGKKRKNEVIDTIADISKAEKLLGWVPRTMFDDGIKLILNSKLIKENF